MFNKFSITFAFFICSTGMLVTLNAADQVSKDKQASSEKVYETTTGFMQELTEIRTHEGPDRSGLEIYEHRCKNCHAKNTQGAPMPDDQFAWKMRLQERGLKLMLKHSMEGTSNYLMPPKGGCRDCNQKEVYAAVFYMLNRSGNKIEQKDIPQTKQAGSPTKVSEKPIRKK